MSWTHRSVTRVVVFLLLLGLPASGRAAPGSLDPTFGVGGIGSALVDGEGNFGCTMQSDGKTVCIGNHDLYPNRRLAAVRFDVNGVPDPTFGTGGISIIATGVDDPQPSDIVAQPDGKLMVAALVRIGINHYTSALVRLNGDGSLDTTFGTGGLVPQGGGSIRKLIRQPDGKFVAGGAIATGVGFNTDFAVTRYLPDGTLDAGFGTAGLARLDLSSSEVIDALALQPDGAVIGTGQTGFSSTSQFAVMRFLADGTPDPGFGTGGGVLASILGGYEVPFAVALQGDGRIVAAGEAGAPGGSAKIGLLRLNANGTVDTSFGTSGIVTTDFSGLGHFAFAVQVDAAGRILAAGRATILNAGPISSSTNDDIRPVLLRYLPNGALDPGFGSGGRVIISVPNIYNGNFNSLLRQPDGKLVAGADINYLSGSTSFAVARFLESVCGNGIVESGEQCDDGNNASGDCCSPTCTLDAPSTACANDGFRCTADQCDGLGTCRHPALETGGCRQSTVAAASRLRVRQQEPLVVWKWLKGAFTAVLDFGENVGSDDYTLCAFDESSPTPALLFEVTAPAGGLCAGVPCWRQHGPILYRDPDRTPNGMQSLELRAGTDGKAKIAAKARGANLTLPALPLPLPVHIQLTAENGGCWEATYGAAGLRRNDANEFQGRGQ